MLQILARWFACFIFVTITNIAAGEPLVFSFTDPANDNRGAIDLLGAVTTFDSATGAFAITLTASQAHPFVGNFMINMNFFNPDTGTTAQNPSFFTDDLQAFNLRTSTTKLVLTGTDTRLLSWDAGERVASNNIPFGNPGGGISAFRSSVLDLPLSCTGIPDPNGNSCSEDVLAQGGLGSTTIEAATTVPGGPSSAPVILATSVGEITGTIGGSGSEDYYSFFWTGGQFSATATIIGANPGASYAFSFNPVFAGCANGPIPLNSGDNFSYTYVSSPLLSAGQYCIGIDANSASDPTFILNFSTPVGGVPEPSSFVLLSISLAVISIFRLWQSKKALRGRTHLGSRK
jgi:hypothetical protein